MNDLYGNSEQPQKDTPTIKLQKNRHDKRIQTESIFILGLKVHGSMSKVAVAEALRSAADAVEESKAEKFTLEYRIEEAKI